MVVAGALLLASLVFVGCKLEDLLASVEPVFSHGSGTYQEELQVSIATAFGTIHYTIDGSTPTESSTAYSTPVTVGRSMTLKAASFSNGTSSTVHSATYELKVKTPTFDQNEGETNASAIHVTDATAGSVIHYTTDQSDPTASSAVLGTGGVSVGTELYLNVIATKDGWTNSDIVRKHFTHPATALGEPAFSVGSGTYREEQQVSITASSGTVYYTTDGSTPTESSTAYSTPVTVGRSMTLKAASFSNGTSSTVHSATYELKVKTPTFDQNEGETNASAIHVTDATAGSVIHYTTDQSDPTASSAVLGTGGVSVGTELYLNVIATKEGWTSSDVVRKHYSSATIHSVSQPVFSPNRSFVEPDATVSITCPTDGAVIYYTTDGSAPKTSSTRQTYRSPFSLSHDTTIKAIGVLTLSTSSSDVTYYSTVAEKLYKCIVMADCVITSAASPMTAGVSTVRITCATPETSIYYTTDGSDPKTSDTKYTYGGPFILEQSATVKAVACREGVFSHSVTVASYTAVVATPAFSPDGGGVAEDGGTQVTITCATPGASIYYVVGGGTPTTSSTLYDGPFTVSETTAVSAIAVKVGCTDSAQATVNFRLPEKCEKPDIYFSSSDSTGNLIGYVFFGSKTSVYTPTTGSTVYYTIDGSTPTRDSYRYDGTGIIFTEECVLKMIATKEGYTDSEVVTYTIKKRSLSNFDIYITPPVSAVISPSNPIALSYDGSTDDPEVTFHYTTDGSTPTESSTLYTGPFNLPGGCKLRVLATCEGGYPAMSEKWFVADGQLYPPVFCPGYLSKPLPFKFGTDKVTILCVDEGAVIHYTTDESTPTESSTVYTEPFILNGPGPVTVKAIATKSGSISSPIETNTYVSHEPDNFLVGTWVARGDSISVSIVVGADTISQKQSSDGNDYSAAGQYRYNSQADACFMNITENNTEEYTIDEATGGPEGYERVYGNNSSIIGVWDHSRISRFYLSPTRHCVVDSGYGTYELNDDTISLTITNWYAYLNDFLENMKRGGLVKQ